MSVLEAQTELFSHYVHYSVLTLGELLTSALAICNLKASAHCSILVSTDNCSTTCSKLKLVSFV